MQDLNYVCMIGRVATEPELKTVGNGTLKLDLCVAFNTTKKTGDKWEDEGNFTNITLWGKTAETMNKLLHKGKQIAINGHLHVDKWEKDGQKQSALRLVADTVWLVGNSKKDESANLSDAESSYSDDGSIPW